MTTKNQKVETFEYKAEMKQLLHLIVHSLYTHPEVFLRELISNASDALNKVRYQQLSDDSIIDKDKELEIRINADEKENTFSIEDNGIGMRKEELIENIGTVARSGTLEFFKKMQEQKKDASELIGQFGVGFYSVFMVTDQVTIETRYATKDAKGLRWISTGEGNYTIEEIDKPARGTKISFKLKESSKEFVQDYKLKGVITKYSNFADFPIYIKDEKVNTVEALWRKNEKEIKPEELNAFYQFVTNNYDDPLGHLHLSIESAGAQFKALIFIPKKAAFELMRTQQHKTVQLYSNKIMIMDDCKELLPEYLQFVRGVVDTSDIPLNVSREMIQASPAISKIRGVLVSKIIQWLQRLAKTEKEKYLEFYKTFGPLFKTGLHSDFKNKEKLIELLMFESSSKKQGEMTTFKQYVLEMKTNQKDIYYLAGDSRERAERNPNLEYFKKHNIEVLFLTDPVDVFVVPSIMEYDKKPIKSIDKDDVDLDLNEDKSEKDKTVESDNLSASLVNVFKDVLKDKVEDVKVSKRLVDSAVTLVTGAQAPDPQMERMMKMMGQDMPVSKRIMEINMDHPLIKNLSRKHLANAKDGLLEKCITQLYESAQFIDGELPSRTAYVDRMMDIMTEATK